MPTLKLTKQSIDSINPEAADALFWDTDLKGFGLKVTKTGAKTYLAQYRMGGRGTPTRRYTIGKHGSPWTPATARSEAERVLRLAQSGTDPQFAAKEQRRLLVDLSFEHYAERFLTDYGRRHWRPRTYASAESDMRRWITPKLKGMSLPSVRAQDAYAILDALPKKSPALPRNVFTLLRKLFAWAVERDDIDRSPLEGKKGPESVKARERVLCDAEVKRIWSASSRRHPLFGAMVRLLMLSGQRRDEVAAMDWSELDPVARLWRLPGSRTKNKRNHEVPLSTLMEAELDLLAGGDRWPQSGLVLSTTGRTPISGFTRFKRQLDLTLSADGGSEIAAWRLHDLRRTVATGFQRLDVRFEVIEALLNHVSGARSGVAGVYQRHEWKAEKANAAQKWSDHLAALSV